jgi:hypothetical protein
LGIDLEGAKHVLGLWISKGDEGAKYWLGVLSEIRNRGVNDVCIVCTDGFSGFADAIETPMAPNHRANMCSASDSGLDQVLADTNIAEPSSGRYDQFTLRQPSMLHSLR